MKKLNSGEWNRRCAGHLLVLAGFGATQEQIEASLRKTKPVTRFPNARFAKEMQVISQLIHGGMPTRIYRAYG